jgi:hypothetical protein
MIIINDNKKLIKYSKTFKNKKNKLKIHNVSKKKKIIRFIVKYYKK